MRYYLIIGRVYERSDTLVVLPQSYPSLEECRAAGNVWVEDHKFAHRYVCVPAPSDRDER